MEPLIINLAPTGAVPARAHSQKVSLQPDEIVADVLRAAEIGITIAHLHARDEQDQPTHCKEVCARIIGGIRQQRPDLILCVSCSGRTVSDPALRAQVLELEGYLKPDLASLKLSSLNFSRHVSVNALEAVRYLAQRMLDAGVKPELEVLDLGMTNVIGYLQARELLRPPFYANLLLGNVATAQADFLEIGTLASRLPQGTIWSMGGIGSAQLSVVAMAVGSAPGVRIGLKDNLWVDPQHRHLASNQELVGREVMAPSRLRTLLQLPHY